MVFTKWKTQKVGVQLHTLHTRFRRPCYAKSDIKNSEEAVTPVLENFIGNVPFRSAKSTLKPLFIKINLITFKHFVKSILNSLRPENSDKFKIKVWRNWLEFGFYHASILNRLKTILLEVLIT